MTERLQIHSPATLLDCTGTIASVLELTGAITTELLKAISILRCHFSQDNTFSFITNRFINTVNDFKTRGITKTQTYQINFNGSNWTWVFPSHPRTATSTFRNTVFSSEILTQKLSLIRFTQWECQLRNSLNAPMTESVKCTSASTLSDTLLRTQTQYIPSKFVNIHSRRCASTFEKTDTPRD
jgi:hypothetical protein